MTLSRTCPGSCQSNPTRAARLPSFARYGSTEYPFSVAVKTGTSQGYRDAWTVAWSQRFLVGAWVGRGDAGIMAGLGGAESAADLVRAAALASLPVASLLDVLSLAQMFAVALPWVLARGLGVPVNPLILLGVFLVIAVEILGIRSLSFAVGFYIPISTTLAIFCGGLVRWLVEKAAARAGHKTEDSDVSPGSLYASGLIAAGGIVGLTGIAVKYMEIKKWLPDQVISISKRVPFLGNADWLSVVMFGVLCFSLFYFARKPLEGEKG